MPFAVGAINSAAVMLVAFHQIGNPVLLALAGAEALLLIARLFTMRDPGRTTDGFFATGLAWALNQALLITLVVLSRDIPATIIVLASSLAAIGSIIGRNFAAPRYAMAQVLLIDLSFKASFSVLYPELLPLVILQSAMFVLMNIAMIEQQRRTTVHAVTAEIENRMQSRRDPLTGLLNRRGMEEAFDALRDGGASPALLYMDLDGFKQVNDGLGHRAGDVLLQEVARRVLATIGQDDVVCRLGGDEFLVLAIDGDADSIRHLASRLIVEVGAPYEVEPAVHARVGISIGAMAGDAKTGLATMMAIADKALYEAKATGKGRFVVHGHDMTVDRAIDTACRAAG